METSTILSLAAVIVSLVGLLLSSRKTTRDDAAGSARVEAKLDGISSGVEDIRVEMRTVRSRVESLAERVSAVESSCKSAHHRLDQLHAHPPD
jgi:outer membrane murein-binding lipoprotein Lpp